MMSDDDEDGIYEVTIPLGGTTHEYIFAVDTDDDGAWDVMEENDPNESCTNGNDQYTNRVLTMPTDDATLGVVCLGSCFPCPPTGLYDFTKPIVNLFPNPANEIVTIQSSQDINKIEIRDVVGRVVYSSKINNRILSLNTSNFSNNIYFVRCLIDDKLIVKKFTINH